MTRDRWTGAVPDEELVRRARGGDDRAFGELVERHTAVAYRVARSMISDDDVAQDVTQNAFLKAYRGLARFRGDAAFRSWLLTIVANEGRGALRRLGRRRETPLADQSPMVTGEKSPEEAAVQAGEVARAREALAHLPEKQRLSVALRVDEGLSFREIGELIGSSEGAARVNYFHGIRRLRELLS